MRRSPNPRTSTPTYQGHLTPQTASSTPQFIGHQILRPRVSAQTSAGYGWGSPMLTPQATMRLNEAANALAAAAAAAIIEATAATPNLSGPIGLPPPRFGSISGSGGGGSGGGGRGGGRCGGGGPGASSEDGESISSNSFFPKNHNGRISDQEACVKVRPWFPH